MIYIISWLTVSAVTDSEMLDAHDHFNWPFPAVPALASFPLKPQEKIFLKLDALLFLKFEQSCMEMESAQNIDWSFCNENL